MNSEAAMVSLKKKRSRPRRRPGGHQNSSASSSVSGVVSESSFSNDSHHRSAQRRKQTKHPPRVIVSRLPILAQVEGQLDQYRAMDCEMVGVGDGGQRSILARVTIVDWFGRVVYDTFVRPTETVTDYRTFVSGVTQADLSDDVSTTSSPRAAPLIDLKECQARVQELLKDKVLVGHGLDNDLTALHLSHPWKDTRDTAKYEPFMKQRFDDGMLWPRKLKELVQEQLHMAIQCPGQPHCAYQDACAALMLYQFVQLQWEAAMEYKLQLSQEIQHRELSATAPAWSTSSPAVSIQG